METTTLRKKTKQVTVHSSGNKTVLIVFKQVTVHSSGNKSVFIVFEQSLCIVLEVGGLFH